MASYTYNDQMGERYSTQNSPEVIAQQMADQAQFGPGSGTIYDPWNQPTYGIRKGVKDYAPGYTGGAGGSIVKFAGGQTPAANAPLTMAPAGSAASQYGGYGTLGGGAPSYAGPSSDTAGGLGKLQKQAVKGLLGLAQRDTTATRKAMEDALYAGQEEGITTAADRARAAMLEGTFGRGVGSSSITTELAGRAAQEQADALARARREAFTQAGAEDRADLASQLALLQNSGALATSAIQGNANIRLADLARQQQASQFGQNLAFQGGENAANRALSQSQFGQNLGLQQQQLAQQGSQFGQNLAFQGGENAANRAAQQALAQMGYQFTGDQNAAQRAMQQYLQESGQTFAGGQNALNRAATQGLATQGYDFQKAQADAQRELQRYLAETGQTFTGQQNQLTRDQSMQQLLLSLANQQEIASGNRTAGAIGAAGAGLSGLLNPFLAQLAKQWGTS